MDRVAHLSLSVGMSATISFSALGARPQAGATSRAAPARVARWAPSPVRATRNASVRSTTQDEVNAAMGRWEDQVRSGAVKNVTSRMAGEMMKEGWVLLDVRPEEEIEKVAIEGAVTVPLFVMDEDLSVPSLLKQMSAFGMGGWWLGGGHMVANPNFMREVQTKIPKDTRVVVGCQKGLRSLAACEQLARAGYAEVAWINGGFDTSEKGDLPTVGGKDIRYAGIGGLSEVLGWTEVQQQDAKAQGKEPGGITTVTKVGLVILAIDGLLFLYEQLSGGLSFGNGN